MEHAQELGAAFHQSVSKALDYNRSLIEETTEFAVSESRNFINLRLERAQQALTRLESCNVSDLAGVQQAWMRDLLQDYADQGVRYAQALQDAARKSMAAAMAIQQPLAAKAHETARETVHDMADEAQHMAQDAQHAGADMAQQAEYAAAPVLHNGSGENQPEWNG
jgi:hypothetical protein